MLKYKFLDFFKSYEIYEDILMKGLKADNLTNANLQFQGDDPPRNMPGGLVPRPPPRSPGINMSKMSVLKLGVKVKK